jgi:hypothetical protein
VSCRLGGNIAARNTTAAQLDRGEESATAVIAIAATGLTAQLMRSQKALFFGLKMLFRCAPEVADINALHASNKLDFPATLRF